MIKNSYIINAKLQILRKNEVESILYIYLYNISYKQIKKYFETYFFQEYREKKVKLKILFYMLLQSVVDLFIIISCMVYDH